MLLIALRLGLVLGIGLSFFPLDAFGQVFYLRDTFCTNQILLINGHLYGPDNPEGTEVIPGGAYNGADSIIEVRLVFFQPSITVLDQPICDNDTIWVNNVPYHAGFSLGEEVIEGGAANGCDSIIKVQLSVHYRGINHIDQVICAGDSLVVNGTTYDAFNPTGLEIIPGGAGEGYCDSIIYIDLIPVTDSYTILQDTLCPDSVVIVNGQRYDKSKPTGLEVLTSSSAFGCDSIVRVDLVFRDLEVNLGEDRQISAGDSLCLQPVLNFQPALLEWEPPLPCQDLSCFPACQVYFSDSAFTLSVTDSSGCVVQDMIQIAVDKTPPVYVPNVFNPDAPWPNNHFFLSAGAGIKQIRQFRIATRWGEIVLEKQNIQPGKPEDGWDGFWKGKNAAPGVYIFWAETEWWDGTSDIISGSFTLLR